MKIKKLSIRGYRSLKDVTWEPGDLNVLIGPNASGKSNFLRGLELLQQGVTGNLDDAIVRQGGIGSILWANERSSGVEWKLKLDLNTQKLSYELMVRPLGFTGSYRIERERFHAYPEGEEERGYRFERDQNDAQLLYNSGLPIDTPRKRLEKTKTALNSVSEFAPESEMLDFCNYLMHWAIYQDLDVYRESPVRRAAITRRETQLAANGQNLVTVLHTLYTTDRDFKEDANDAMRAAFGREFEGLEFTPAEDQRIQMRLQWKSFKTAQSAVDLSDGTLRFLMLLAILANRSRGDLVAIDEPETGLHPNMFPIIAEFAAEASRASQIIFATHSPEFLTAIGSHNPKTTVVQIAEGETKLSVLDGDDLKKWLQKYTLGELFVSGGAEALA